MIKISNFKIAIDKYSINDSIVGFMRRRSDLEIHSKKLSFGSISYFSNKESQKEKSETLVFIHGFGSDKDNWVELAALFTAQYRVILLDLPGHGDSVQDLSLSYTIQKQADYLNEFLSTLDVDNMHIVGNSMGGAVATRYVYLHHENVKSLILLNSHGAVKTPSYVDILYQKTGATPMLDISSVEDFKKAMGIAIEKSRYISKFMLEVLAKKKLNVSHSKKN
ncbi:MAG: alpha/beta fold hydrolase [Thiohalomonadales bacterium]